MLKILTQFYLLELLPVVWRPESAGDSKGLLEDIDLFTPSFVSKGPDSGAVPNGRLSALVSGLESADRALSWWYLSELDDLRWPTGVAADSVLK